MLYEYTPQLRAVCSCGQTLPFVTPVAVTELTVYYTTDSGPWLRVYILSGVGFSISYACRLLVEFLFTRAGGFLFNVFFFPALAARSTKERVLGVIFKLPTYTFKKLRGISLTTGGSVMSFSSSMRATGARFYSKKSPPQETPDA